jgi:flagellar M-ring protein FliF
LRGAREADIARSIEAINVIKAARVQLALPEQSVFLRESPASSASVMLTLQPGQSLAVTQVRAIRHLVAASVASLLPENVSIIDQSGALLSQADAAGDNASFALQVQIEDHYRRAIQDLLAPVIGRENFSTELHVDVDPTESQSTRETYPKNDTALRKEEGNRTNSPLPAAPAASGIPGALSNQPPPAAQLSLLPASAAPGSSPATAPTPSQSAETFNRAFEVGREISVTHQPVGRVRRLTVAVAVRATKDAKRPAAADVPALETLVKGAVGYDAARGDLVVVNARDFAVAAPPKVNFWDQPWFMPVVRQIFGVVSGLAVLWFIARPSWRYFKRQTEDRQQLLADLKHELSLAPEPQAITLDMIESTPRYADRAQLVRQYVRQDTERARQIVRQMIGGAAGG